MRKLFICCYCQCCGSRLYILHLRSKIYKFGVVLCNPARLYIIVLFSIQDEAKESRMRVASLVEDVQSTQDKRSALYQSYDDAINKFKSTKRRQLICSQQEKDRWGLQESHITYQLCTESAQV